MTPPLINLLEWITEPRELFYLLDYQFLIKGYNSGRARWKISRARYGERAQRFHVFSKHATLLESTSIHQPGTLQTPSFWVFLEASLLRHDGLNH